MNMKQPEPKPKRMTRLDRTRGVRHVAALAHCRVPHAQAGEDVMNNIVHTWNAAALKLLPTIHQGQCCDCKLDGDGIRVWVCRVAGGVTVEQYQPDTGRWERVAGDCYTTNYGEVHYEART